MDSLAELKREFYLRPAEEVARDLIGCQLTRNYYQNETLLGQKHFLIVETEAYVGDFDKACHAYKGRTQRTEVLYSIGGSIYIYLIYGLHNMLNIVTGEEEKPAAVLIRALEPLGKIEHSSSKTRVTQGPGKLCKYLDIDRSFNQQDLIHDKEINIRARGTDFKIKSICSSPRINIDYAEEWKDKPLRFFISNNAFVSGKVRSC